MAEFQNVFTRVQVKGPVHMGAPLPRGSWARTGKPFHAYVLGLIGDAQIGPIYLGFSGVASIIFAFIAIEIIGFNFFAQVDYSPQESLRQLFWLGLEPPAPAYGLSIPPLAEGGWWGIAGFFLTASILLWWVRMYRRARALGMYGHARRLGVRVGDLPVSVAGL